MAIIIDGNAEAKKIKDRLRPEIEALASARKRPGLAVVLVGDNPASKTYVGGKEKDCNELGIYSERHDMPEKTTMAELLTLVRHLASDERIHGILVQSPLPAHLDEEAVIAEIPPEKDVDAFHPYNVGRIMIGNYDLLPCTPAGVMELIAAAGVSVSGKECVVVGRSNIVGKPMAMLLLHASGTVTVCHSRTKNLAEVCRRADILVSAAGKAKLITADMVKPGAVVIDVGMNRDENGKLCGDVDFASVEPVCGYITPVPGGVGPMTRAILMKNTVAAAKL